MFKTAWVSVKACYFFILYYDYSSYQYLIVAVLYYLGVYEMAFFRNTRANFSEIINLVSRYIQHLPPNASRRMGYWLMVERAMRRPARPQHGRHLPRSVQHAIENQASVFTGYMVLFAHDDAVDQYNLDTAAIYAQLSRCLAAFIMSITLQNEPQTAGALRASMRQWFERMRVLLGDNPEIVPELPELFDNPSMLSGIPDHEPLVIQQLFFKEEFDGVCREWLNMTIVSAMGMGQAFRNISNLMKQSGMDDAAALQRRCEFLVKTMVRCMYAQAHSPEQKNLNTIHYERFMKLACLKSTELLDMSNYVSDQVNEERFFATRHNASRLCDQIYDDINDFEEDTRDWVLNILHVHVLEQGRLAKKFLEMSAQHHVSISMVQDLLNGTKILQTAFDHTFIYRNPFIQAARDPHDNLRMDPADAETILREIWVNAPGEVGWTIEALVQQRLALYESLKAAWRTRNYPAVLDAIYASNFPLALMQSLHRFVRQNKWVSIEAHKKYGSQVAGYVSYYSVSLNIVFSWLGVWKKRMVRSIAVPFFISTRGNQDYDDPR